MNITVLDEDEALPKCAARHSTECVSVFLVLQEC